MQSSAATQISQSIAYRQSLKPGSIAHQNIKTRPMRKASNIDQQAMMQNYPFLAHAMTHCLHRRHILHIYIYAG
jgi:hypothetical protein